MNILISTNASYMGIISVMVYSLCKSHKDKRIDLYVAHRDLTEKELDTFRKILNSFEEKYLHEIYMGEDVTNRFDANDRFSVETYYRIFALEKLPRDMERIIYLDGDMIVKGDLTDIYSLEMDEHCPFAVCEDVDGYIRNNYNMIQDRAGIPHTSKCFNAGFMLINLRYMRSHNNIEYIKEAFCREHGNYQFHDQDILNHMFYDRVRYVPWEQYNLPAEWWYLDYDELIKGKLRYASYGELYDDKIDKDRRFINISEQMRANAKVIHYFGLLKPWIYNEENIYADVAFYAPIWWEHEKEMRDKILID